MGVALVEADTDALDVAVVDQVDDPLRVVLGDVEVDTDDEGVVLGVMLALAPKLKEALGVPAPLGVPVGVCVPVTDSVVEPEGDALREALAVAEPEGVELPVTVPTALPLELGV